jgi:prevent-host-death family protein
MKSVSVAKLKSNLSQYLNAVKRGTEIIVTSHRHPVARLVPLAKGSPAVEIIAARLPVSSLKKIRGIKLKADPVAYLLADRRRR